MSGQQYGGQQHGGSGMSGQQYGGYGQQWNEMNGPHVGRGPKNFQRSDERVKEDVCNRLEQNGQIDASEINVRMKNGVVTLTGSVEDRQMKRLAEDIAENAPGVKEVQNQLRVTNQGSEQGRHETGRNKDKDKDREQTRHAG
jgi:osmotically-inducible protein OsmY